MSKKRPSNPALQSIAHWNTPQGKTLQNCCCQQSMPVSAIKADLSKQSQNNSYGPPMWHVDQKRNCQDCGKEFAWTAKKQPARDSHCCAAAAAMRGSGGIGRPNAHKTPFSRSRRKAGVLKSSGLPSDV